MLTKNEFRKLNLVYSDLQNEAAYTSSPWLLLKSANKMYGHKSFSYDQIDEFLKSLDAHTLYRQIPTIYKKSNFRPFNIGSVNEQWQADLADMSRHKLVNSPTFLLCVIDTFSKFAFVRGIPSKHGHIVAEAFKNVFTEAASHPEFVCTDFGKEFINATVKQTLYSFGVKKIFQTTGNNKAAIVERFISSLRMLITKFLVHNKLNRLDPSHLQLIVNHYNRRKHSSTGKSPLDIWIQRPNVQHAKKLFDNDAMQIDYAGEDPLIWLEAFQHRSKQLLKTMKKSKLVKFQVGDNVRVAEYRRLFNTRINSNRYTFEIFKVSRVHYPIHERDVVTYSIKGFNHVKMKWEVIDGRFYQHELIKTEQRDHDDTLYK